MRKRNGFNHLTSNIARNLTQQSIHEIPDMSHGLRGFIREKLMNKLWPQFNDFRAATIQYLPLKSLQYFDEQDN